LGYNSKRSDSKTDLDEDIGDAIERYQASLENSLKMGFAERVAEKTTFCLFLDNELVSATDSENIPNSPEGIINLGVNTVKEHRRKGYAATVCSAFIKHYLEQGVLPLWECDFDNEASEKLALKLGFKFMGNLFFASAF
jgi:RimJ/RimL family protein N-acetyltransferase